MTDWMMALVREVDPWLSIPIKNSLKLHFLPIDPGEERGDLLMTQARVSEIGPPLPPPPAKEEKEERDEREREREIKFWILG